MTHRVFTVAVLVTSMLPAGWDTARAQAPAATTVQRETVVPTRASGEFDVRMTPQTMSDPAGMATLGRMALDKQYHGDLVATGKGEMLVAGSTIPNSAVYSAVELVSGTLQGRTGTFAIQHTGIMTRGTPSLVITVVPDSGTGQLTGITGSMNIIIEGRKHFYTFDYTLPGS